MNKILSGTEFEPRTSNFESDCEVGTYNTTIEFKRQYLAVTAISKQKSIVERQLTEWYNAA